MPGAIRIRHLRYAYDDTARTRPIFDDLDWVLEGSAAVAILGRSGSGKSTLLSLIAGLDTPLSGSISIDDVELTALGERQRTEFRRCHMGIVFQNYNLIPTLSVRDNLRLPLELNGVDAQAREKRIDSLLERLGLSAVHARFPGELSGGEQQRVAVLRALVHEPLMVLADEPTGSLDQDNGRKVLDALHDLVVSERRRLVLVTHSLEVARVADEVYVMENGRLQPYRDGIAW